MPRPPPLLPPPPKPREIRDQLLATIAVPIHFDFDKSDIRPGDGDLLDQKAAILQANPALTLQIAGNADERGSVEYNLALGNRRAAAAKRYLMNKGIDGGRLEVISYGEERPGQPWAQRSGLVREPARRLRRDGWR